MNRAAGWLLAAVVVMGGAYGFSAYQSSRVVQPINFSHEKHVGMKLPCGMCHKYFTTRRVSGRPSVATCAICHRALPPRTPEMVKLRGFIDRNQEIPWRRVYKVPKHVYYSHRTHVVDAKLDCAVCHGAVDKQKNALTKPLKAISMDACLACHVKRKVTSDCNACHK